MKKGLRVAGLATLLGLATLSAKAESYSEAKDSLQAHSYTIDNDGFVYDTLGNYLTGVEYTGNSVVSPVFIRDGTADSALFYNYLDQFTCDDSTAEADTIANLPKQYAYFFDGDSALVIDNLERHINGDAEIRVRKTPMIYSHADNINEILISGDLPAIGMGMDPEKEGKQELEKLIAYPNPFNDRVSIDLDSEYDILITNMRGDRVRRFKGHGIKPTTITWDGKDDYGKKLPSGNYRITDLENQRSVNSVYLK